MEPIRNRAWEVRSAAIGSEEVAALATTLKIPEILARLLLLRGIDDAASARTFLEGNLSLLPDPSFMAGMEKAVSRLVKAIRNDEKILVHGDYDVDGISATALLVEFLDKLGAEVGYHIPLRLKDGYGLSAAAIDKAAAQNVSVVVSVDCGVTAVEEASVAAGYGIDLIITDHHQPPDVLPKAYAIINPHLPDCRFPDPNLAGVGVAFFLLVALRKALREDGFFDTACPEPDLRYSLDLVALGTIADIVPLIGVNRLLTKSGLKVLNSGKRIGVGALKAVAGINDIDAGSVGFKLGPRLNAAGRIEDAALGVRLLLSDDNDEAAEIAALLDDFNRERQNIEVKTLRQAEKGVAELSEERRTIVLADPEWHPGVIGIVASRLVERYYRPTFLLAIENGQAKGSGRSTRDIDLYQALQECSGHLKGYGGHAAAAGLSLDSNAIDHFSESFEQAVIRQQAEPDRPLVGYDGEVLIEELTAEAINELDRLSPFGMGNPSPQFVVRNVAVSGLKVVGDRHLKFTARQDAYTISCIAFGLAERQDELVGEVELLFVPELNHWKGRTEVQLRVRDFRRAAGSKG